MHEELVSSTSASYCQNRTSKMVRGERNLINEKSPGETGALLLYSDVLALRRPTDLR
jgi:hypothetical protein